MTTIDVYIRRIKGTGNSGGPGSVSMHNGMIGPATAALHALIEQFKTGTLTGPWRSSYIEATVQGSVVRAVISAVTKATTEDPQAHQEEGTWTTVVAYREGIDDVAQYTIKAIEV
jgi:hypothetical protein